ncbi:MAG: phenylalanine--tRNA ligase subunit alpha [Spirochaetales bacterium]|nr:phenylalanine--tRNA ligase subunit alpha [Spirochaetales bacterium]
MSLYQEITALEKEALAALGAVESIAGLEEIKNRYTGKKGALTGILKGLKDLSDADKRTLGKQAHSLSTLLEESIASRRRELENREMQNRLLAERFDALRPLRSLSGHLHPLSRIQYEIEDLFTSMGFLIMDGPEVETDANNFTHLNFSADHPARDMQDTFWTTDGFLLRTHTSPVQVRAMQKLKPPFRIIAPGRVYRYEEIDASHEHTFFQVEGMMVDEDISVAHLIHIMKSFLSQLFDREVAVRLRPGYFPFVEPGFELDFSCLICNGQGCRVCKQSGWVESGGSGLVHPEVLRAGGIDPDRFSGFAFGFGLNRLAMMKYGIEDIRHFMQGNLRFLEQF